MNEHIQHDPGDLTARARIRDAALEQFAERGTDATTMRGIATAAGVSLGLVQHHFGTKQGLRRACDEYVIDVFNRRLLELHESDRLADENVLAELFAESPLLLRYLSRASVDGSSAAYEVFARLAEGTAAFLTSTWPERFPPDDERTTNAATVMTAMHVGTILLIDPIAHRLGTSPATTLDTGRIPLAMLDIYSAMGEFADSRTGRGIRDSVRDIGSEHSTEATGDGA